MNYEKIYKSYVRSVFSDGGTAEECTKSELNNYLCGTELTADNFTPVEGIKK